LSYPEPQVLAISIVQIGSGRERENLVTAQQSRNDPLWKQVVLASVAAAPDFCEIVTNLLVYMK